MNDATDPRARWIAPMLVAAALAVGWPLLLPWTYETHEGKGAAFEAAQLAAAARDGQLPVRWLPDLDGGRGLPVFLYASPLAFYAIALVHASGVGVLVATKVVTLLALVLAGFAAQAWLKTHVPAPAAAVGAVAYGAAPILAALVHVTGDPATVTAYALVPLVLLAARHAKRDWAGVGWLGLAFGAVVLADRPTAFALLPPLALYALNVPVRVACGVALGGLISVFQWGPAWAESDLVQSVRASSPFGVVALVKLAAIPAALLVTVVAFGKGRTRLLAALGIAGLLVAFAVDPVKPLLLAALLTASVAALFGSSGAGPLRLLLVALSVVPPLVTAAFAIARRDLMLGLLAAGEVVAGAVAIAAATLDERITLRGPPAIAGLLVALVLPWSAVPIKSALTGDPPVHVLSERDLAPEQVRSSGGRTRSGDAAVPRTVTLGIPPPSAAFDVRGGQLEVTVLARTAKRLALDVDSESGGILALELNDFPGWELSLAGAPDWHPEEVAHGSDRAGRIAVSVPPGRFRLEARWTETPFRRRCDEASAAGAGMIVVLLALSGLAKPHVTIRRRPGVGDR